MRYNNNNENNTQLNHKIEQMDSEGRDRDPSFHHMHLVRRPAENHGRRDFR